MKVHVIPILKDNYTFILDWEDEEKSAWVIDPGQADAVIEKLEDTDLKLRYILNTHHHEDHIAGNKVLLEKYNADLCIYKEEQRILGADILLEEGTCSLEHRSFQLIHCPGHTQHHVMYYFENEKVLFTGDVLFRLGCGRNFEGDEKDLLNSMKKVNALPGEVEVYCAHEYTLNNFAFHKSIEENDELELIEKKILFDLEQFHRSIPFSLKEQKEFNLFLRYRDKNLWSLIEADSEEAYLKELRKLKDEF